MMYTVYAENKYVGKMNSEYLRRWLLKRRSETQTDLILISVSQFGRHERKGLLIKRVVEKGETI